MIIINKAKTRVERKPVKQINFYVSIESCSSMYVGHVLSSVLLVLLCGERGGRRFVSDYIMLQETGSKTRRLCHKTKSEPPRPKVWKDEVEKSEKTTWKDRVSVRKKDSNQTQWKPDFRERTGSTYAMTAKTHDSDQTCFRCQAKVLTSRHVLKHRVMPWMSNTLGKLMIRYWGLVFR